MADRIGGKFLTNEITPAPGWVKWRPGETGECAIELKQLPSHGRIRGSRERR